MRRGVLAGLLLLGCAVPLVADLPYSVEATVRIYGETGHRRDSLAVVDEDKRDTWESGSAGEVLAQHRVVSESALFLVDHGIYYDPAPRSWPRTGTGGTGAENPARAEISHEIYQAFLRSSLVPGAELTAGRQILWEEGNPAGLFFSVTDGLHPRGALRDRNPGFDGVEFRFGGDSRRFLSAALAFQDAFDDTEGTDTPWRLVRGAFTAERALSEELRWGGTVVMQRDTMVRPGVYASRGGERFLGGTEIALECYNPHEQDWQPRVLAGFSGGFREELPQGGYLELTGEYHYNGLALNHTSQDPPFQVTSDGAGAFLRPGEHYLQMRLRLEGSSRWRSEHRVTRNLDDQSMLVEQEILFLGILPFEAGAEIIWTSGAADSEFGAFQEDLLLRLFAGVRF
ncbi:hypothetical protein SAMN05920897_10474 [Alkalispirochaeta americana]|uniref:Alginate export n=1 Tax=Alkalispirochaeta americana TaxID=159291 RepID=A0A1N6Q9W8_9SPIO|nr:hypothetical protein [Alkalispirochaeta americana]SIQ13369.1 hypothetical protein SAMN05920897_10474 [Alkalispirochaeta americana]